MPRYILVHETASTNTYMARMAAMLPSNTVIYTPKQTAGRGQRGNSWECEPDKNLAFSMLLKSPDIAPNRQFFISEAVSLAIIDTLNDVANGFCIKWPNDIYHGNGKVAGILIEHTLTTKAISQTIIGVGLNVNQTTWLSDAPNPLSIKQITGEDSNLTDLLHDICSRIESYCQFAGYSPQQFTDLHSRYLKNLYRADSKPHTFAMPDGTLFEATIHDVKPDGTLCLQMSDGEIRQFAFKQVAFVI